MQEGLPTTEISSLNKTVAILGGSGFVKPLLKKYKPGEIDVWWLNKMHELSNWADYEPYITMYWDIHPFFRMNRRHEWNHIEWLEAIILKFEKPWRDPALYPIMMRRKYKRVPGSIGYPIRGVAEMARGVPIGRLFGCTHAMMMGYAVLQEYENIECYGVNLMNPIETYLEKPSWSFWYGQAIARGISIDLTHSPYIMPSVTYFNDRLGQIINQFTPAVVSYQVWGTEMTGNHDEFAMTHDDWTKLHEAQGD